eukprot:TRINITY_DN6951_c0_g1_i3.p1 TRINITY_DN6951_c0_g1~~TRINITY_DN6951_c0_g1_i3.p1  ORF type:complete len:563 (+),score=200.65 TRINITY_DN6951_c0_g1_i3:667-2355(+)
MSISYAYILICRISAMISHFFADEVPVCSISDLSKFFFILGHVALKELVYIEEVQSEIRRRRSAAQEKATKKDKKAKSAIEEELGVAAAAEEQEAETLQEVAEKEIVGKNLLGTFGPIVSLVCANAGNRFNDQTLRTSAVLALSKFMCVSSDFCDKHLQLLFTILQTAPEPAVRSNVVISLGDLAFRFPNLIEPWTSKIYSRLRDSDTLVRKNTMMVLSHLILNDMIKVKGQISEMALCLEDEDSRISDLAHLFFHELSQKGNAIYNILPDLISGLSVTRDVTEVMFKSIMKYLFTFIEKDKQAESLVEKLCHRLKTVKEVEQWRSLSYCLSLLNINDKALKKLNELYKCYEDKLGDPEVHASFVVVAGKAKKFMKPETKDALAELERRLSVQQEEHQENENAGNAGPEGADTSPKRKEAAPKKGRPARKAPPKKKGRGRKKAESESEPESEPEDSEEEQVRYAESSESEEESAPKTPKKKEKSKEKAKPKEKELEDSESEEDRMEVESKEEKDESESESSDEEPVVDKKKKGKVAETPAKKARAPAKRARVTPARKRGGKS